MVSRDHLVEAKLIKELPLISVLPPHHRRPSCCLPSRNHCSFGSSSPFSTASAKSRHSRLETNLSFSDGGSGPDPGGQGTNQVLLGLQLPGQHKGTGSRSDQWSP